MNRTEKTNVDEQTKAPTDEDLMRRIALSDEAAFREFLNRFERRVYALAWRLTGGNRADAEDLAQDVFLKVWKNAALWQPTGSLVSWLYRLVYNDFTDKVRARRPTEELNAETMTADGESVEEAVIRKSESERVKAALDALPDRQREVLILCCYQELKAKEAAEVLGMKQNAVEVLLFRARKALKDLLEKEKNHD